MNKKRIAYSLLLFLFVFCVLGLPFTDWWFFGADDFHAVFLGFKTKSWNDLLYFFYDGHVGQGAGPSNYLQPTQRTSFLGTYYRPLYLVYVTLQYWLFGTNAYYYFLTNIFFHALNTMILFNIFLWFTGYFPAFLTALLFAVHPQIAYRFSAIVNLHYYINVTLMLSTLLFFKHYLDTKKWIFNLLACLAFILSLFTRESSIVLPTILFLGSYFYLNLKNQMNIKHFFGEFFLHLKNIVGFIFVACSFLSLRLYLYPLKFSTETSQKISLLSFLKNKIPEFKVLIYDIFTLSWMPWGRPYFRGIILISILSIFSWIFIKNEHKEYVIYFFLSGGLLLWPGIVGFYSPRYMYEAYAFILLGFITCCSFYRGPLIKLKPIFLGLMSLIVITYSGFCFDSFSRRTEKHSALSHAVFELVQNPLVKNRSLCFIAYPLDGVADPAIFRILLNDPTKIIYFDPSTAIRQIDSNIVTPTRWCNIISSYHDKNYFTVSLNGNEVRLTSLDASKINFDTNSYGCSLGKKVIHKTEKKLKGQEVVTDFSLIIDKQYQKNNPIFIRWDYAKKRFEIMGN